MFEQELEQAPQTLQLLRITLFGAANSGKTSLINAFVNNFCPTIYTTTDDPALYYKTVMLTSEDSLQAQFPMLVEIEDTYACSRRDGVDCHGLHRDIRSFLDIFSTSKPLEKRNAIQTGRLPIGNEGPFGGFCEPPVTGRYVPASTNRMGFMLVFDAGDQSSLDEIIRLHKDIEINMRKITHSLEPVVFLIANKMDTDTEITEPVRKVGEKYARDKRLGYAEVSALELRKVRRMFRTVLADIHQRPSLWLVRPERPIETPGQSAVAIVDGDDGGAPPPRRTAGLASVVEGGPQECGVQ